MPSDTQEPSRAVPERAPTPTAGPEPQKEKPVPATNTATDDISTARDLEPGHSRAEGTTEEERTASDSKNSNVHVHVSRRSTETGDSKIYKPRLLIRWPTTKEQPELGPGIHWYTPVMMILLGLAGLFGALGHHLYNAGLDGRPVVNAQWPQRWGVAMAFFVKMTLVGAVQMAVKQRAWVSGQSLCSLFPASCELT